MMTQTDANAKPFLKWAGGKRQLIPQLLPLLPKEIHKRPFIYVEPFVGGGAMLFYMLQNFNNIEKVVINDINGKLTDAYKVIKDDVEGLILMLRNFEREYVSLPTEELKKDFYLSCRKSFNEKDLDILERTTLLIFLNRTCFNGLYRENSKGHFNVPFGRYANPLICNEPVLLADSELLNSCEIEIMNDDFTATAKHIDFDKLSFIYLDPPYRPLSATSNFNTFSKGGFDDDCQRELANFCKSLSSPSSMWMQSNSDCSSHNSEDRFFEDLYNGFDIQRVFAARAINSNGSKRGKLTELVIRNYTD